MTPTALWDIYYHAIKEWIPHATDKKVRGIVDKLMEVSEKAGDNKHEGERNENVH